MIIRALILYLLYLKCRIKYRKQIWFRGFSIICAMKGSEIQFNNVGGGKIFIFSHPFSNMIGLSQRAIIIAKNGGKICINEGVCMSGCTIYSMEKIVIGRNTDIGSGCKIIDNDFHPLSYSDRYPVERKNVIRKRPIVIGEGCFIGANTIILKGTTLGRNVVVGAGSVVCGTFPDNVIIAGNPAKIIKENLS
ncbi:acyltransferase [uncultured Catenibacterium sp.]|uniref:acyltransferase n=1 Tax=uncultured Catenibacterium sp. TaxID=286142 RepID=UPI0025F0CD61|nr:acyltransferase [uncultured Catenibacterium sp.]